MSGRITCGNEADSWLWLEDMGKPQMEQKACRNRHPSFDF